MVSMLRWFSLGRVAASIAVAIGWTPVGKRMLIYGAEGPLAKMVNGREGTVRKMDGASLLVELVDECTGEIVSFRLTPRHVGWDGRSLVLTPVAMLVDRANRIDRNDTCIAMVAVKR